MAKLSTIEKVIEAREKAKRGRRKGFHHSEETKEKMREIKLRAAENREADMRTFSLEEVIAQAKEDIEKSCDIYNVDLGERHRLEVYANSWSGSWILNYTAFGLEEAFGRVKQMLAWKQTKTVTIRTIEKEIKDRQELTAIMKVGERYVLEEEYKKAEREGR